MYTRMVLTWILMMVCMCGRVFGQRSHEAAINQIGRHQSPHRVNEAILELQEGDALRLVLDRKHSTVVDDVSGIAWMSDYLLVYSVSPVYGKPGIFKYDYRARKSEVVVKPISFDSAYPDGADFFKLHSIDRNQGALQFYYGTNVDSIDFNAFWTPDHLFKVNLDGSGRVKLNR